MSNRKIGGVTVTPRHIQIAEQNGIGFKALSKRLQAGKPLAEAITRPLRPVPPSKRKDMFNAKEIEQIVGRIKYLNEHEAEFPFPIPKPIRVKMEQLNLKLEDIKPVPVEECT